MDPPDLDPRMEGDALAVMAAGLLSAMLVGAYDADQATRIVDHRLGQLFPG